MAVSFTGLPSGATVDGNSATFTPTKPYAIAASIALWTNNDNTGSFDSAANWMGGIVPQSGDFTVNISEDTVITVTNTYSLGGMTVQGSGTVTFGGSGSIGAATLNVGSGLTVDTGGKLAVTGFSGAGNVILTPAVNAITLSSASTLTGDLTIKTDTNTAFNVNAAISVNKFYVNAATTKYLKFLDGARFKPDGVHYLNVTEKLVGAIKVDLGDLTLAGKGKIPLLKVPISLKTTADSAIDVSLVPYGWHLMVKEADGNVFYDLRKKEFLIIIK